MMAEDWFLIPAVTSSRLKRPSSPPQVRHARDSESGVVEN